jgi:Trk K+ transport system NAD-binding subunit
MENPDIIAALLAKRAEIGKAIADLQRQERKRKAEMVQLDATIKLFAPSVTLAKREATKFARSVHFVVGELSRRCNQALREANGQPITADMLAVAAMREKGLDLGDGELRQDIGRRFLWTLARMLPRKGVVRDGYGAGAGWTLPEVQRHDG